VLRTNNEVEFFNNESVKEDLRDILVIWSCTNLDMQYVQGMNDIAAIIQLAFSQEAVANPYASCSDEELIRSYFYSMN